ncbi:DUF6194 family protein [Rariglobus hedericola]|uniref:DUF6194 domain-containing protein n=1 Tax=Rariglobus hedericola TaxID=2597822 RepID=A0A556QRJ9_9BACT|nr:DUF6194 family protein [Rariglobus hedericola]TSJ79252.1 hypothetical protein FPL22_08155 [Rariglobus hedericola]
MNEAEIIRYIVENFPGVEAATADGNTFFFYDPERKLPFATIVANDDYDTVSNLGRPDVFRLNVGVSKATCAQLFSVENATFDYTALDTLMPHPIYAKMHWLCILSPSSATWETTIIPLVMEAYTLDVGRQARRA